jgi:hypothetical protein
MHLAVFPITSVAKISVFTASIHHAALTVTLAVFLISLCRCLPESHARSGVPHFLSKLCIHHLLLSSLTLIESSLLFQFSKDGISVACYPEN